MKIVVTIKQTFTTEAKISIENGSVSDKGIKNIVNAYDEFAVEEAIKAREAGREVERAMKSIRRGRS